MSEGPNSDEEIDRQSSLNDDSTKRVAVEGIGQAERIVDRLHTVEKAIDESNHQLSQNGEKIEELQSRLEKIEDKQDQAANKIENVESTVNTELESVQTQLNTISKNAGLSFPSQIRAKITIPIVVTLLAFSILSGGIDLLNGNDIPLRAQLSAAGTLGMLTLEAIEYRR